MKILPVGRTISALLLATALVSGCNSTSPEPQIIDRIEIISGDGQGAAAGTALPDPLVVQVSGPNGEPVVGAHIAWTVVSGGGSVSSTLTATGSDGRAHTTWTVGKTTGVNSLTASIQESGITGYEVAFGAVAL